MRQIEYVPSPCKPGQDGQAPAFQGRVILKALRNDERMALMEDMLSLNLALSAESNANSALSQMKTVRKMISAVAHLYISVDIKQTLEDGSTQEFKSYDDLDYDASAMPILVDVASHIFGMVQGSSIPKN